MAKYLEWGGLLTLWTKIKNYVSGYSYITTTGSNNTNTVYIGPSNFIPVTGVTAGTGLNTTSNDSTTDGGSIGGTNNSGTIYLTKSGVTAGDYGPSTNATPSAGTTFDVPQVTVDKYGRVTGASTKTVTIPAAPSSFNITVTDGILDGTGGANSVLYTPWSSENKAAGRLYSGTTNPTNETRLNYDGNFYATKLYSNGSEVVTSSSVGNKALKVSSNTGTATLAITMNESSADRTLTISGDGTYLSGAVSGSSNAPIITISHSDPTADANSELTAAISGTAGTYAIDTEYTLLTGVKAQRDAKGHITGLTYTALKVKDTDTKVNVRTRNSAKAYLLGTTTAPTSSKQAVESVAETGVYISGTAEIVANNFQGEINKVDISPKTAGFKITGGTTSKTLTVNNTYTLGAACAKSVDTSIGSSSSSNLPTTDAVKTYVASLMSSVVGALVYKGVITSESTLLNTALTKGWYYIVNMPETTPATTNITIGGVECESGDMVIVNTAGTYTTSSGLGAAVDVILSNIAVITDTEINGLS